MLKFTTPGRNSVTVLLRYENFWNPTESFESRSFSEVTTFIVDVGVKVLVLLQKDGTNKFDRQRQ